MTPRGALVPASTAARLLGVHVRTMRRWIAADVIRGTRVASYRKGCARRRWFVQRAALDAWLARLGSEPPAV